MRVEGPVRSKCLCWRDGMVLMKIHLWRFTNYDKILIEMLQNQLIVLRYRLILQITVPVITYVDKSLFTHGVMYQDFVFGGV